MQVTALLRAPRVRGLEPRPTRAEHVQGLGPRGRGGHHHCRPVGSHVAGVNQRRHDGMGVSCVAGSTPRTHAMGVLCVASSTPRTHASTKRSPRVQHVQQSGSASASELTRVASVVFRHCPPVPPLNTAHPTPPPLPRLACHQHAHCPRDGTATFRKRRTDPD